MNRVSPIWSHGVAYSLVASPRRPRSRSTSTARWLMMCARGVFATQFNIGDHVHPHPVGGQRQRGGAAHGTGAHDNDVGVVAIHGPERHEGGRRKDRGVHGTFSKAVSRGAVSTAVVY